ncbi:GntR family transcriptional regulator [Rothia sp. CCM 9417]|uniref:GntR family transcriptional regulator n=1 Tax=Rothia sp. CCM 9417 TaxID=3402657 RepID=UPI003AE8ADE4
MNITIRDNSPLPVYQQIHDAVVQAIATGQLAYGDQLLSVRAVAQELSINPATVLKAYDLLKAEGLIVSHNRGKTTVAADPHHTATDLDSSSWEEALLHLLALGRAQGRDTEAILLTARQQLTWLESQQEASHV